MIVVPWAAAVMTTAATLHEGWLRAYPGALPGAIVAVLAVWGVAYWWFRMLRAPAPQAVYADR